MNGKQTFILKRGNSRFMQKQKPHLARQARRGTVVVFRLPLLDVLGRVKPAQGFYLGFLPSVVQSRGGTSRQQAT